MISVYYFLRTGSHFVTINSWVFCIFCHGKPWSNSGKQVLQDRTGSILSYHYPFRWFVRNVSDMLQPFNKFLFHFKRFGDVWMFCWCTAWLRRDTQLDLLGPRIDDFLEIPRSQRQPSPGPIGCVISMQLSWVKPACFGENHVSRYPWWYF